MTDPIAPPLDPELVAPLAAFRALLPPLGAATLPAHRAFDDEWAPALTELAADDRIRVDELRVPGSAGDPEVVLLVIRPAAGEGPWPVLYNTHGGGMVVGSARSEIRYYLPYVREGLAALVCVDYRLAPEHPDPAPIEDCYAGLSWIARHAEELMLDPARILLVGASAGGGLAAGLALLARDRGFPSIAHQVLMCPMLDDRCETPSSRMLAPGEGLWDREENLFGWTSLLGERRGGTEVSAYAAPARADDLAGLPDTFIDVGTVDAFRDEATRYALRLARAGVAVEFHSWAGGFHGFEVMVPEAAVSRVALEVRDAFIRRALIAR